MNQREHRFQSFADRFIDRVVLPPMWTTGVDHASNTTDNARARAAGRGIKFGTPDVYVLQGDPTVSVWIELKAGRNDASDRQEGVMRAIERCGIRTGVARSIDDVMAILAQCGFRLHGNAANIAIEVQARLDAAQMKALQPKKARAYKPREKRQSPAHVARMERLRMLPR